MATRVIIQWKDWGEPFEDKLWAYQLQSGSLSAAYLQRAYFLKRLAVTEPVIYKKKK